VDGFKFIELTTESTVSSYGYPVLRIHTGDVYEDYLPGDLIAETAGRMVLARDYVVRWLAEPGRTAEDVELGQRFLG
jgi:hypothetical protein